MYYHGDKIPYTPPACLYMKFASLVTFLVTTVTIEIYLNVNNAEAIRIKGQSEANSSEDKMGSYIKQIPVCLS